jgi:hypothetical protein
LTSGACLESAGRRPIPARTKEGRQSEKADFKLETDDFKYEKGVLIIETDDYKKLKNLDTGLLGPQHREEAIVTELGVRHLDLIDPAVHRRHIEELIAALQT